MIVSILPKKEGKGRAFTLEMPAVLLYGPQNDKDFRPAFAVFAGTQGEVRPFMSNLRLGRPMVEGKAGYNRHPRKLSFLKSTKWRVLWQKEAEGWLATMADPDLFTPDPGMVDPEGIEFVVLTSQAVLAQQSPAPAALEHLQRVGLPPGALPHLLLLERLAPIFTVYLDRRTRCPLVTDSKFHLQILVHALNQGLASFPNDSLWYPPYHNDTWGENHRDFRQDGFPDLGLVALSFKASHDAFESFLSEQVVLYFGAHGKA